MKIRTHFFRSFIMITMVIILALSVSSTGSATELEKKASSLNNQLSTLEAELSEATTKMQETAAEIESQKASLSEAEATKQKQYEDMKLRIRYMYENGPHAMLETIVESNSLAAIQTNVEYAQAITEYDHNMLEKYKEIYEEVLTKDEELQTKRSELALLQTSLDNKIKSVEKTLASTNSAIEQEKQKKALEEELKKAQQLAQVSSPSVSQKEESKKEEPTKSEEQNNNIQPTPQPTPTPEPTPTPVQPEENGSSGSSALYSLAQFMRAGRINWNGYTFTYYSQSVLPGGALQIPGRHVNADGYVSDGSGYICLAGSAPMGTVYDTPFGYQGKIYDRGTSGNHLDVYIR
ncbi:MAG TPA: hypothetical protein H9887_04825 [Candidatus Dorea intestinavium]|nr:hypothetical protein [Candidatus Dorea intestinavium]